MTNHQEQVPLVYRETILDRFRNELEAFRAIRGRSSVHKQLKKATELTAQEYGNRFLVELIQNAHDAADANARNGRIGIQLNLTDGPHGTLYVANTGRPFDSESFKSICEFAQSSKRPGESIGNKGVGVRSVLQVCDWPEIYSVAPDVRSDNALGFAFRFAQRADLIAFTGDEALALDISQSVSAYSLPIPCDTLPDDVQTYLKRGYVTVVRLPLRDEMAAHATVTALTACYDRDAPLTLFLSRLSEIEFTTVTEQGIETRRVTRCERPSQVPSSTADLRIREVDLRFDGADSSSVSFLIGILRLPEAEILDAIERAVVQDKLPSEWRQWSGDAFVSAGIPLHGPLCSRLYNYLPMGVGATSPFYGYLDAPFYSKLDRTSLDPSNPLNDLLFEHGTAACLRLAESLASDREGDHAEAVCRLIAWSDNEVPRLATYCTRSGVPLTEKALIPIERIGNEPQKYETVDGVYRWNPPPNVTSLTRARIHEAAGISFLDDRIPEQIIQRLSRIRTSTAEKDFKPSFQRLASWVESVAVWMGANNAPLEDWDGFYSDIATVFAANGDLLQGKQLILSENGELVHAGAADSIPVAERTRPTVFLAPVRERTEDEEEIEADEEIGIPDALLAFVRYTHLNLRWVNRGTESSIRMFFVQHKLVRRFGKRELRDFLRSLLVVERAAEEYSAALEFAYRIMGGDPDVVNPAADEMNLKVPVVGGSWVSADAALFSVGWNTEGAVRLSELVTIVRTVSPEIEEYVADVIPPPGEWPFEIKDVTDFGRFLESVGVLDGLWPWHLQVNTPQAKGSHWSVSSIAQQIGLSSQCTEAWVGEVAARPDHFRYPNHEYAISDEYVWTLAGQDSYESWPRSAKEIFAELVAAGISSWADESFWCRFDKKGGISDHRLWPSPVTALLARTEWLPISRQSDPETAFVRPSAAWFWRGDAQPPEFIPTVRSKVRRRLQRTSTGEARIEKILRGRFWDNPQDSAAAIEELHRAFLEGAVPESLYGLFGNSYKQKWREVLTADNADALRSIARSGTLIVRRSHVLSVWRAGEASPAIIQDIHDLVRDQILEEADVPLFSVHQAGANPPNSLGALRALLSTAAIAASELQVALDLDGNRFDPRLDQPYLKDGELGAVIEFVALFITLKTSLAQLQRGEALERLQSIRLVLADEITAAVVGLESITEPTRPECIAYPDTDTPMLLITRETLGRGTLQPSFAQPICELVGIQNSSSHLELAFRRAVDAMGGSVQLGPEHLPNDLLCSALHVSAARLEEAKALLVRSARSVCGLIIPVVAYSIEGDWSEDWYQSIVGAPNMDELTRLLEPINSKLPVGINDLLSVCSKEARAWDVRDKLQLDYARFNEAVRRIGHGYKPQVDPDAHRLAFEAFIASNSQWIIDALRARFWSAYESNQPLDRYTAARQKRGLVVDDAWLEQYRVPPDALMKRRVESWLESLGKPYSPPNLTELATVRDTNRQLLLDFQTRAQNIVLAWSRGREMGLPPTWVIAEPSLPEYAFEHGWTDFEVLSDHVIIARLQSGGKWPAAMPATLDLEVLGLTPSDLERSREEKQQEKLAKDTARRSITIDDSTFVVSEESLHSIAQAVRSAISDDTLNVDPRRTADLAALALSTKRKSSGRPGQPAARTVITDEQRLGIGFVGEVVVCEWLRQQYPNLDPYECWKSGFKNLLLGRTDGSDELGYDFAVPSGSRQFLYEVKSAVGEAGEFALAESQVREAQRTSADNKIKYRIVFVANVLDSAHRRIIVLPNPFSVRGARDLRVVGKGMRFQFDLDK